MSQVLTERMPDFARCLIEKMMIYSLGRGITPSDRRSVAQMQNNWAANGFKFQTLIYEVAHSAAFQSRRGEAPGADTPKNETGTPKRKEVAAK